MSELQFGAVQRVLAGDGAYLLDEYSTRLLADLRLLAQAYDAWDKFQHGEFNKHYHKVDRSIAELAGFLLAEGIIDRVQSMAKAGAKEPKKPTEDHLADLWNNAERRVREGRYDDAVARLYRLTEMIAQYELIRAHGVDTSNVNLNALQLSADRQATLATRRNPRNGRIEIGLQDDYTLLADLHSPLGAAFQQREILSTLLGKRNASILAHGREPVAEADARSMLAEVAALAECAVPGFGERCASLQFPWLA